MQPFHPGTTLHERFTLRERIGMGGMSEVWLADDRVLARQVAVKVLGSPLAADPLLRAATWHEARAAARLTHPHVTQVYDYGEAPLPGGVIVAYLVMEFVAGQSLADRLRSGPLPWPEAVRMGSQVAAALAAAHGLGIVHRDVKPGNVMLTPSGAKVLDFGIAALAGGRPDTGPDGGPRLVGTPAYAAPEQLRAVPAAPAADVYALGVLLYQALAGETPIRAATWSQAAAAHRAGVDVVPLEVPGLPRSVTRLCRACLATDPDDRPTAAEVAAGLAAGVGDHPAATTAQPAATPATPAPTGRARAGYAVGSAALPHPATMIESRPAVVPVTGSRPASRSLLFGLVGAVFALGLALVVVTVALMSGTGGRPSGLTPVTSQPFPSSSATPSATPSPTSSAAVVDQIELVIGDALAAGRIDADTAQTLSDRLRDLRDSLGRGRLHKEVQDFRKKVSELVDDERLDQATADQLDALLDLLDSGG